MPILKEQTSLHFDDTIFKLFFINDVVMVMSNWQPVSIGCGEGVTKNSQQAITRTNVDTSLCRKVVTRRHSLSLN